MAIGAYSGAIIGDRMEGLAGFFVGLIVGMFISIIVALDRRNSDAPSER